MKLHLPFGLRKALLSCLTALSAALPVTLASGTLGAEDITLGGENSIAPDEELDASVHAVLRAAEEQEEAMLISETSFGIDPDPLSRPYSGNFDDLPETVLQPASREGTLALDSTVDQSAQLARQSLLQLKEDRLFSNTAVIASDGVQVLEATATPEGVPGILATNNWGLVFEDQFDGKSSDDSALNTRLWTRIPYESPNQANNWRAHQSIDKDLVSFEDKDGNSTMRLWGKYGKHTNQNNQNNTTQDVYACGGVRSQGVFSFQYGYVEVRAKYENAKGVWPAIWMMPERVQAGLDGGGWPRSGEIDIMEHLNYEGKFYQTLHRAAAKGGVDSQISVAQPTLNKDAWHTYGVEWTAQSITFYLDGGQTGKIAWDESGYTLYGAKGAVTGSHTWTEGERELWPFDYAGNTFYLILDQQIGGGWPGNPDDASKKTLSSQGVSMWIDYVKVYSDVEKYNHLGKCTLTWQEAGGTWAETEGSLWNKGAFLAADSVVFGEVTTKDVTISGAVHATNMDVNAAGYTFTGAREDAKLVVRETLTLADGATVNLAVSAEIGRLSGAGNLTTSGTGKTLCLYTWNGDYSADPYTGTITVSNGWNLVVSSAGVSAGTIDLTQQGDNNYLVFDSNNSGVYLGDITLNANLVGVKNVQGRGGRKVTITGTVSGVDRVLSVTKYSGAGLSNCFVFEGDVSRFTGFDATTGMANTTSVFTSGIAAFTFKAGLALSGDTTFNVGDYDNDSASNANPKPVSRNWIELTETSRLTGEGDIIKTGAGELEIDGDTSGYSGTMRLQVGKLILDGIDGSQVDVSLENATADANVVNLNASKRAGASGGVLRSVGMGGEAVSGKVMLGAGAKWTLQEVTLTTGETLTIGGAAGSSITLGGSEGMNLTGGTLVLSAGVAFGGKLNITLTGSDLPAGLIGLEAGANLKGLKLNLVGLQQAVEAAGGILEWKYQLFSLPTVGEDGQNDAQKALAQEWLNQMDVPYEGCSLFVDESGFISLRKADLVWSSPSDTVWKEGKTGWGEGGTDVFQSGCTVTFGATSAVTTVTIDGPVSVNNMNVNGAYTFSGNGSNSQLKVGGALSLGGNATIGLSSTIAVLSGTGDLTIGNTGTNVVTITEVDSEFTGSIKLANESRLKLDDGTYSGTLKLTGELAYLTAHNEELSVEAEGQGEHVLSFFYAQQIGNATGLSGINVGGDGANATVKDLTAGVGGATFTFDNSRNGEGSWAGYSGSLTVTGTVSGYTGFVAKHAGARTYSDIIFTGTVKLGDTASFATEGSSSHRTPQVGTWASLSIIEFSDGSVITGTDTTITKTGAGKLKIAGDTSGLTGTLKLQGGGLELNGIDGSGIAVSLENATVNSNVMNLGGNGGVLGSVGVGESVTSGKVMLAAGASWTLNGISLTNNQTLTISGGAGSSVNLGGNGGINLTGGTLELGSGVAFSGELKIALTGSGDPTGLIKLQENVNLDALGLSLTGLGAAIGDTSVSTWNYQLFSGNLDGGVLDLAEAWLAGAKLDEDYADYKLVPDANGAVSLELRYLTWSSTTDGVWQNNDATGDWKREGTFSNGKSVAFSGDGKKDVTISGAVQPADMTVSGTGYKFQEQESGTNNLEVTGTLNLAENTTTTLGLKATIARLTGGTASAGGEEGLAVAAETPAPELVIERTGKDADAAHEVWIKDASGYNGTIKVGSGGLLVVRPTESNGTFTAPGATVDLSGGGVLAFDTASYTGNVVFNANLKGVTKLHGKGGRRVTIIGSVEGLNQKLTVEAYNNAGLYDCFVFDGDVSAFSGFDATANMANTVTHFPGGIAAFTFKAGLALSNNTTFNVGDYDNDSDSGTDPESVSRNWIELTETSQLTGTGDIIKTGAGELEIDGDTSGYSGTMKLQAGKLILDGIDGTNVSVSLENTNGDANVLDLNVTKRTPATDDAGEEVELTGSVLKSVSIGGSATSGKVMLAAGASWTLNEISLTNNQTLTISGGAGSSVNLGGDEGVNLTDGTLALDGGVTFYGALNVALAGDKSPKVDLKDTTDFSNLGLHVTGLSNVIGDGSADNWSYQLFSTQLSGDLLAGVKNWLKGVELEASYADSYRLSVKSDGQTIYLRSLVLTWVGTEATWTEEGSVTTTWAREALFERGDQVLFGETSQKTVQIDGGVTASEMTVEADGYTFSAKAEGKENDALTVTGTLNLARNTTTTLGLKTTIASLSGEGGDGAAPKLVIERSGQDPAAAHEVWIKDASEYNGTIEVKGGGLLVVRLAAGADGTFTAPGMTVDLSGGGVLAFDNNTDGYYKGNVIFNANLTGVIKLQAKGGRNVAVTGTVQGNNSSLTAEKYAGAGLSACFVFEGAVSGFTGFTTGADMCNPSLHGQKTIAAFTFKSGLTLSGSTTFDVADYDNVNTANRHWIELTESSSLTGTGDIIKTGAGELEIDGNTSGYSGTMKLQAGKLILDGIDGSRVDVSLENATADANVVNLNASKRAGASGGVLKSVSVGEGATSGKVMLGAGASWTLNEISLTAQQTLTISGGEGSSLTLGGDGGMSLPDGTLALGAGVAFGGQLNVVLSVDSVSTGAIGLEDNTNLSGLTLNLVGLEAVVRGAPEEWGGYKLFSTELSGDLLSKVKDWLKEVDLGTPYRDSYRLSVKSDGQIYLRPLVLTWDGGAVTWTEGSEAGEWKGGNSFERGDQVLFEETGKGTVEIDGAVTASEMTVNVSGYTFSAKAEGKEGDALTVTGTLSLEENAETTIELSSTINELSGDGNLTIGNTGTNVVTITEVGDDFSGSIKLANESRLKLDDGTYSGTLKLTGELAYLTAHNEELSVEAEGQGEHVLSFFYAQQIGNATGLSGINVGGDGANATVKDLTAGVGGATFTFDNSRNGSGVWAGYSGSLTVTGTVRGYTGFVAKHAGARTYSDIIFTGTVNLGTEASFDTEGSSSHKTPQVGTWAALSTIEFSSGSTITGTDTTITKTGAGKLKIAGDTSGLTGTLKLQGGVLELNGIDGSGIVLSLEDAEAETTLQGAGVLGRVDIGGDAASGEVVLGTGASWRVENMGIQKGQVLTITGGTDANVRFGTETGEVSSMVLGGTLALNGGTYDGALKLQLGSDAREDGVQIVIGDGVEIGREDVTLKIEVTAAFIERLNETWRYKLFDGKMTEELAAHVLVEPDEEIRKKGCTFTVGSDGYLTVARLAERYWNGGPAPLEWGGNSTPWTDRDGKGAYSWENERVLEDRNSYMDVHFTAESGEHTVNVLNQDGGPIEADQLTIGGAAAGKTQSYTFSGGSLEIQKSLTSGANTDLKVENSITVKGKAEVEGVLTVSGGGEVSVGTNSSVKAVMVEEEGKFTAGKGLKVAGNLEVNGTAQFEQVEVGGKVSVGQGAELNSTDTLTVQSLEVHGNLNSAGALMAQSLEVRGNVSLDGGGAVKGDVTLGNGGSLKATGNLEIAGKVVAEGGSLVVQQGGKLITGAWEGSLSSLTLNYGASVTMNGTIAGTVNLGALVHNGDSELVLDGLKDVSAGMMLSVSGTTGDGQLTVRLSTEFLDSIVNSGNRYTLFDTRNHAEITGIEIGEELGYIIGMDWKTGILTVEMEAAPEIQPDSVYTSSEEQNDSDEWKTREPGANIYYDVASYEEIRIDKNTSINISDESRPEYHFGETGLVLHNLQGKEAGAELSVIGGAKNDIVTLQDWENEKTDSRVVTYGGTLRVENAKLRIDHGKRDEEGVVLNEEKAASVFANFTGSLDLSKGKGLEMALGVLELSGAENDLGSGGITFTNATELSQLILSAGETRAAGEITVQTATMFAALNESPVDEETQPIGRQEHILLQDGAILALGAESKKTIIGDGVVIGYAPAAPTETDDGSARSTDATEDSGALTGTVSMRGKVNLAAGARVTGVHMEFEEGAEVTWHAGSAASAQDEIYGLVATGGKLSGGKDIAIRVKEWKPGVCSPTMCSGMDFSNYTGKMTIRKSENNQVFAGVTGGAGWNMDVESGGRVVFDVLNDAGQNAAWTMGDVTLRSGAILTLCFTLDGPTMLRATSQPNMSFNSFSAEKGARLTLYSDSVIPPTEESYVLGTVTDVMKSGLGEDSIIIPELQGTAFWRVSEARVCLEGRELLLKLSMDGNNKLLAAMDPDASQNAKAGAEALWQLVGKTDSARVMGELADPDSDIKKLADDAGLRSEFGDAKGLEKLMAGSVGASFVGVAPALGQDMHRQLSAIRNRTASMGSEVSPTDGTDGRTSWHAWINAESGYHELDDDGLQPGYRLNGWGGTVGIDADVSPSTTVGLALSAMYNDLKSSAADSMTSDLDTCYLSFFQRHMSGRWSHTLVLSVGMASLDSKRTVALTGGSYTASGDTDGYALGALYEVGYTHGLDPERFGALQSVFNVEFRRVSLSGFEEHGSAAALHVDDMEETVVTFGAGLRYQRFMGTRVVNRSALLELRALARVDAGDTRGEAVTGFLDGDYRNHLRGAEIGRIGAELGAGVTVPVGTSGSIFVDASLELRSGYTSFDASAGYRIGF